MFAIYAFFVFFRQKHIAVLVLILRLALRFVINEATLQFTAIVEDNPAIANSLIVLPLSFVQITILVVVISSAASYVIFEIALVKLTVLK